VSTTAPRLKTNAGAASPAAQHGARAGQVAQQCVNDLQALGLKMDQDGFWLIGYGGGRWGSGTRATTATDPAGPIPPSARVQTYPWGDELTGMESPRYQIRVLYDAATVLAHRGDQPACQAVVTELREIYDQHVARLRQAGVEPGQVTSWRQERIAAAQPVTQLDMTIVGVGDITGTEVRNLQGRRLGTVTDVVVAPCATAR
jgi:hypothetical protein